MALTEKIRSKIITQDCEVLGKSHPFPDWLIGTPTYVDEETYSRPLTGSEAVKALRILKSQEEENGHPVPDEKGAETGSREENAFESVQDAELEEGGDATSNGANASTFTNGGKVTEQDLQRYIAARNSSPASAGGGAPNQPF